MNYLKMFGLGAVLAIIGGLGFVVWLKSHELANCRAQQTALIQAEKTTTEQAKAEQKQADAKLVAQAKQEALQAHKAAVLASQIAQAARSSQVATQGMVNKIASHNANAKAWQDTPIPASVLQAIGGGS